MSKKLNIHGLYNYGYKIVQSGMISFGLLDRENRTVVEFEIDDINNDIEFVHTRLLSEIDYHIRNIKEDDDDYFADCENNEEIKHIKGAYLDELLLIGNILR